MLLAADGPQRCLLLLERLTDAARFDAVKLLLDAEDRRRLRRVAGQLQRHGADLTLLTRRFFD